jgi:cation transporter-like permease
LGINQVRTKLGRTQATGDDLSQQRKKEIKPPFGAIVGSILGLVAWLVFILAYALFWSRSYTLFQNFIVTVASLLIVGLLIGLMWVVWGFRTGWRGGPREWGDW